uniref:SH2 domain-containing protein n=2 Tax=Mesocestoides corti TaxID=53468 RepID=A0A5K3F7B5_MESCO
MKATETDLGTNDPDNVLLYPAPNYMQSAPTVREHVGEVRSPTARSCRAEEVVIPINRQTSSATSGYVSKQGTAFSRGFGPEHQPSTENYTPSVCRATSPKSFSLSNGAGESCFSSTAFNRISSPNSSTFCANETNTTHLLPVQSPFYRDSQVAPPPVLTRETSRRFDTGTDDISRTEWSRREESVRETGSIRRFPVRPTATSPNNTTPLLNGHLQHLPPLSPPTTKTNSNSVRIIRSPTRVQKTGGDIITTEEVLKEDDNTETIIRRRTIRRKRIPQSPLAIREDTVSEDVRRTASTVLGRNQSRNEGSMLWSPGPPKPAYPTSTTINLSDYMNTHRSGFNGNAQVTHFQHSTRSHWSKREDDAPRKLAIPAHTSRLYSVVNDTARPFARNSALSRSLMGPPPRTFSQTNIQHHSNTLRNHWSSENNLRTGSYLKQPPIYGTYSAHQENLRRRNELNQQAEAKHPASPPRPTSLLARQSTHLRSSRRMSETGYGEIYQETVSLQPIGRGIQDLEAGSNPATLPRVGSHTAARSFSAGGDNRGQYYSGTQSPVPPRQPGGRMVSEHRSRMVHNESHWCNVNGLGSSLGSLHGGSLTAGPAQTNHLAVDTIDSRHTLSHTNELSHQWFRPHTTRDEAHQMLINKEPGRFIIRQSKSQPNSYALVVRVPVSLDDAEPVRTFLLNRVKGGDAVHLQGFELEPIFPSLSAFVHDHTIHQGALPVLLKLPMRGALSSSYLAGHSPSPARRDGTLVPDFVCDVLYLGSVDVFPLQGDSAVRRAVEQILSQANNPHKGLKKKCEATVHCASDKGLTIFDKNSARFTKKTIPANKILYCAYDPDERVFNGVELKNHGVADSQIFAIVVKKTRFTMTEHAVYVMCQLEPNQPSSSLINYINQNYTTTYRR